MEDGQDDVGGNVQSQLKQGCGRSRKTKVVDPLFYQDDSLSVGGRLKKDGQVIQRRQREKNSNLNINCRVEPIGLIVQGLCATKRNWVREMGFECLVHLADKMLPRKLCYWLATRVDVFNKSFVSVDGKVFPLSKNQVRCVLGIPIGNKPVPTKAVGKQMVDKISDIKLRYNTTTEGGTAGITRRTMLTVVEGPATDPAEFKLAFLMLILADLLTPTTCTRFPVGLLPALTVAEEALQYDWCSFVVDRLLNAISSFAKNFYNDGFSKGCGGCTAFLAIFYLDRLRKLPPSWGLYPRMKAWSMTEINAMKKADRLPTGDFGKLGCVDAAYGERHPMEARDLAPVGGQSDAMQKLKHIIDAELQNQFDFEHTNADEVTTKPRKQRRQTTNMNPYARKMSTLAGCSLNNDDRNVSNSTSSTSLNQVTSTVQQIVSTYGCDLYPEASWSPPRSAHTWSAWCSRQHNSNELFPSPSRSLGNCYDEPSEQHNSWNVSHEHGNSFDEANSVVVNQTSHSPTVGTKSIVSDDEIQKSRAHRKVKSSVKMSSSYVHCWRSRHIWKYKRKLPIQLRKWGGIDSMVEMVVFRCNGKEATLKTCWKILLPEPVDMTYVQVASALYTKVWDDRHFGRSKRYMVDPNFAMHVLDCDTGKYDHSVFSAALKPLLGLRANKLNMVVIPVLEGGRWWCAIVSINRGEVLVLDPLETNNSADVNHVSTKKLLHALDEMLYLLDSTWSLGCAAEFQQCSLQLETQGDMNSSGVHMLIGVKRIADRLRSRLRTVDTSIADERESLIVEDLVNKFNTCSEDVKRMMANFGQTNV